MKLRNKLKALGYTKTSVLAVIDARYARGVPKDYDDRSGLCFEFKRGGNVEAYECFRQLQMALAGYDDVRLWPFDPEVEGPDWFATSEARRMTFLAFLLTWLDDDDTQL